MSLDERLNIEFGLTPKISKENGKIFSTSLLGYAPMRGVIVYVINR